MTYKLNIGGLLILAVMLVIILVALNARPAQAQVSGHPLYEGWNQIIWQFTGVVGKENVDCALDLATGNESGDGNWIAVARFNGTEWDLIYNDPTLLPELSTLDQLEAGEGYWIYTKFGGTIVFSDEYHPDPSCS